MKNHRIKTLIVDDEPMAREFMAKLLSDFKNIDIVGAVDGVDAAMKIITREHAELVFLDVQMQPKDGFELVKELKELGIETTIVFVTGYDHFAIRAIKCASFDYILKPVDPAELKKAIERYTQHRKIKSLQKQIEGIAACLQNQKLQITTRSGIHFIDPSQIVYCLAEGNYTELFLENGLTYTASIKIGNLPGRIGTNCMCRAGRSHLINKNYLAKIDTKNKTVLLKTSTDNILLKIGKKGITELICTE